MALFHSNNGSAVNLPLQDRFAHERGRQWCVCRHAHVAVAFEELGRNWTGAGGTTFTAARRHDQAGIVVCDCDVQVGPRASDITVINGRKSDVIQLSKGLLLGVLKVSRWTV